MIKQYIIGFICLLGLSTCAKIIELDSPDGKSKIVVNSLVSNDSPLKVYVSKSVNVLEDDEAEAIIDAKVDLYLGQEKIETLTYQEDEKAYISVFTDFLPEKNYNLEVSVDGLDKVTATAFLPKDISISNFSSEVVEYEYDGFNDGFVYSDKYLEFSVVINDPKGEENYYGIAVFDTVITYYAEPPYFESEEVEENRQLYVSSNDPIFSWEDYIYDETFIFTDDLFDGEAKELTFSCYLDEPLSDSNIVRVEFWSMSKSMYQYYLSYSRYQDAKDLMMFSEPVQVFSNVTDGYGVFAGYSKKSILLSE